MIANYINKIGWFIGLVLLQVLILNNVNIAGYATPFLYVYFILKFSSGTSRNELMLWGFALGLVVDVFSNTPGMNAAATVFLAFVRPFFLQLFVPRDTQEIVPSLKNLGFSPYIKYILTTIFIHHSLLFTITYFSFVDVQTLLIKTISSTVLTVICIIAIEEVRS